MVLSRSEEWEETLGTFSFEQQEDEDGTDVAPSSDDDGGDGDGGGGGSGSDNDNDNDNDNDDIEVDNTSAEETYYSEDDSGRHSPLPTPDFDDENDDRSRSSYSGSSYRDGDDNSRRPSQSSQSHEEGSYHSSRRGSLAGDEEGSRSHDSNREEESYYSGESQSYYSSASEGGTGSQRSRDRSYSSHPDGDEQGEDSNRSGDESYRSSRSGGSAGSAGRSYTSRSGGAEEGSYYSSRSEGSRSYYSGEDDGSRGSRSYDSRSHHDDEEGKEGEGSVVSQGRHDEEGSYSSRSTSLRSRRTSRRRASERSQSSTGSTNSEQSDYSSHPSQSSHSDGQSQDNDLPFHESVGGSLIDQPVPEETEEEKSENDDGDAMEPLDDRSQNKDATNRIVASERGFGGGTMEDAAIAWPAADTAMNDDWPVEATTDVTTEQDAFGTMDAEFPPIDATIFDTAADAFGDGGAAFGDDLFGADAPTTAFPKDDLFGDGQENMFETNQPPPSDKPNDDPFGGNDLFGETAPPSTDLFDETAFGDTDQQPIVDNLQEELAAEETATNVAERVENAKCNPPSEDGLTDENEPSDGDDEHSQEASERVETEVGESSSHGTKDRSDKGSEEGKEEEQGAEFEDESSKSTWSSLVEPEDLANEGKDNVSEATEDKASPDENQIEGSPSAFPDDDFQSDDSFGEAPPKPLSMQSLQSEEYDDDLFDNESFGEAPPKPISMQSLQSEEYDDDLFDNESFGEAPPKPISMQSLQSEEYDDDLFDSKTKDPFNDDDTFFGKQQESKPSALFDNAEAFPADDNDFSEKGSGSLQKPSEEAFEGSSFGNDQSSARRSVGTSAQGSMDDDFFSQRTDSGRDADDFFASTASKSMASQSISTRASKASRSSGSSKNSPRDTAADASADFFGGAATVQSFDTTSDIVSMASKFSRASRSSRSSGDSSESIGSTKKLTSRPSISEYLPASLKKSDQIVMDAQSAEPSIGIADVFGTVLTSPGAPSHDSSTSVSDRSRGSRGSRGSSSRASHRKSMSSRKETDVKSMVINEDEELKDSNDDLSFGVFSANQGSDPQMGSVSSRSSSRRSTGPSPRRSKRRGSTRSDATAQASIENELKSFIDSYSEKDDNSQAPTPATVETDGAIDASENSVHADAFAKSEFAEDLFATSTSEPKATTTTSGEDPGDFTFSFATNDPIFGDESFQSPTQSRHRVKDAFVDANLFTESPAKSTKSSSSQTSKHTDVVDSIPAVLESEESIEQISTTRDSPTTQYKKSSEISDMQENTISHGLEKSMTIGEVFGKSRVGSFVRDPEPAPPTKAEESMTIGDVFGKSKVGSFARDSNSLPSQAEQENEEEDAGSYASKSQHSGSSNSHESRSRSRRSDSYAASSRYSDNSADGYSRESRRSDYSSRRSSRRSDYSGRSRGSGSHDRSHSSRSGSFQSSRSSHDQRSDSYVSDNGSPSAQNSEEVSRRSQESGSHDRRSHSGRSESYQSSHPSQSSRRSYDRSQSNGSKHVQESISRSQSPRLTKDADLAERSQDSRSDFYESDDSGMERQVRESAKIFSGSDYEDDLSRSSRSRQSSRSRRSSRSRSTRESSRDRSQSSRPTKDADFAERSQDSRSDFYQSDDPSVERQVRKSAKIFSGSDYEDDQSQRSHESGSYDRRPSSRSESYQSSHPSQSSRSSYARSRSSRSRSARHSSSRSKSSRRRKELDYADRSQDSRSDFYKSDDPSVERQVRESAKILSGGDYEDQSQSSRSHSRRRYSDSTATSKERSGSLRSERSEFNALDPSGRRELESLEGSFSDDESRRSKRSFSSEEYSKKSTSRKSDRKSKSSSRGGRATFSTNEDIKRSRGRQRGSSGVVGRTEKPSRDSFGASFSSSVGSIEESLRFSSHRRRPPTVPEDDKSTGKDSYSSFEASFSSRSYEHSEASELSLTKDDEENALAFEETYVPPVLEPAEEESSQSEPVQPSSQSTGESSESSRVPKSPPEVLDETSKAIAEGNVSVKENDDDSAASSDEQSTEQKEEDWMNLSLLKTDAVPVETSPSNLPRAVAIADPTATLSGSRSVMALREFGVALTNKKENVYASIKNEGYLSAVEESYRMILELRPRIRYMLSLAEWSHIHALMLYARVFDCELAAARIAQPNEFRIQIPASLQVLEPLGVVLESIGIVEDASTGVRYVPVAKPLHKKPDEEQEQYEPPDPDDVTEFLEWTQYNWNSSWIKVEQAREARKVMASADGLQLPEKTFPANHSKLLEWEHLALEKWLGWDENLWFSYNQTVQMLGRKLSFVDFPKTSALGTYSWLLPREVVDRKSTTITSKEPKSVEKVICRVPKPSLSAEVWMIAILFDLSALDEDRTKTWYCRTNPAKNPTGLLTTFLRSAILPSANK